MTRSLCAIKMALVISVASAFVGCNQPTSPSPTAVPPTGPGPRVGIPVPPGNYSTISGTVWNHAAAGVKPYSGSLFGWIEMDRSGWTTGRLDVDASGRYSFKVPTGSRVRLQAMDGTYQPCAVTTHVTGDVTRDFRVVSDTRQLGSRLPGELLAATPILSGVVFEATSAGRRPLSDVRVELDGLYGMGVVTATTLTDSDGRYVLCGLEGDSSTYLFASKSGYRLFEASVPLSGNTTLEIELQR